MEETSLSILRDRIIKQRASFPFLPSYLGLWGLAKRCELEKKNRSGDEAFAAFCQDLNQYLTFGRGYIKEQAKAKDPLEADSVASYCLDAFRDTGFEDVEELLKELLAYYEGNDFIPSRKQILLLDIVLGNQRGHYPWRGKPYARELEESLKEIGGPKEAYLGLNTFYRCVLDFVSAERIARLGADELYKQGKKEDSAVVLLSALEAGLQIPDYVFPEEKQIKYAYGRLSDKVLSYRSRVYLRHDPIESSEQFQQAYDEVMEKAMGRYIKEGEPIVHRLWELMEDGFKAKGIQWKNPQRMNPGVRFD